MNREYDVEVALKHADLSVNQAKAALKQCLVARQAIVWLENADEIDENLYHALAVHEGLFEFLQTNGAFDRKMSSPHAFVTLASLIDLRLTLLPTFGPCYQNYWPILRLVMRQVSVSDAMLSSSSYLDALETAWNDFCDTGENRDGDDDGDADDDNEKAPKVDMLADALAKARPLVSGDIDGKRTAVLSAFEQVESICNRQAWIHEKIKQLF